MSRLTQIGLLMVMLILLTGFLSVGVQAADVNITGNLVASACKVDSSKVTKEVNFGQLHRTELKDAGTASPWQSFEILLTECPQGINRATATFSGAPAVEDNMLYANSGTAANIAVQVAEDADKTKVLGNGQKMTVDVDTQRQVMFKLASRLLSVNGNTGPGNFSSVVQLTFTYQ